MKKMLAIYLLIISCISFGQNQEIIDSLIHDIEKNKNTYEEIRSLYELSCEYIENNYFNETDSINKIIIKKLKENYPNDTLLVETYNVWAVSYRIQNITDKSDSLFVLRKNEAKRLNHHVFENTFLADKSIALNKFYSGHIEASLIAFDSLEKVAIKLDTTKPRELKILKEFYDNYAIVQAGANMLDKALPNFVKVKNIAFLLLQKDNQSSIIAYIKSVNNLALCYDYLHDLENSITYYQEALNLAQKYSFIGEVAAISSNLSALHLKQYNFDKAIEYAFISIKTDHYSGAEAYNNLGVAYLNKKDYSVAKKYLLRYFSKTLMTNRKDKIALAYQNLGELYSKLDQIDSAHYSLNKALEIYQQLELKNKISSVYQSKGALYYKTKNYKKALEHLENAQKYLDTTKILTIDHYKNSYFQFKCFNELNDKANALLQLYKAFDYKKRLDSIQNIDKVNELEIKYQTGQKENEILRLKNENNEKKAALAQSRLLNLSGAGVLILVLGIGFFFWQQKKQQLKVTLLENSIQAAEMEKRRIGKELHDGIAGRIIKLVKDTEYKDLKLSDQLLGTYNEVRRLSHQLDNTPIHNETFVDRLIDLIPQDHQDKNYSMKISPVTLELKESIGNHLFRIIQELIANNLKHAQANQTNIFLNLEQDILSLNYEDNGIGIKEFKKGNGFENMENRLALMNGKMQVITNLPQGLKVEIRIPYIHEKD